MSGGRGEGGERNRCTVVVEVQLAPELQADVLRRAADALYTEDGPQHPLSTAAWLRERADRLTTENFDFARPNWVCINDYCVLCGHLITQHSSTTHEFTAAGDILAQLRATQ